MAELYCVQWEVWLDNIIDYSENCFGFGVWCHGASWHHSFHRGVFSRLSLLVVGCCWGLRGQTRLI